MSILFWICLFLIFYIFSGYSLLITFLAWLRPKAVSQTDHLPSVSILLPVYNEEERIEKRIKNLLSLDYPSEDIEILIGSDGSGDNTNEILNKIKDKRLRIFIFEERRGKPSVLNALAEQAKGEVFVFADCRQDWKEDSLKMLVRNFADEKIGVVSGLAYEGKKGFYRRYENFIRSQESKFASVPGATGPIYALRAKLFKALPKDTILDDFVIPMEAIKQRFYSVVEPSVIAYDITFNSRHEKIRKARTLAGNFQAFFRYYWLLNPFQNPIWFQTFSHKFLRLTTPLFLLLIFISNLSLLEANIFYRLVFILQILLYLSAGIGKIRMNEKINSKVIRRFLLLTAAFIELNWAVVLGLWSFLTGKASVKWQKYKEKL